VLSKEFSSISEEGTIEALNAMALKGIPKIPCMDICGNRLLFSSIP
jgi:hypothetical protein